MASMPAFAEEPTASQIEVADVDESTPEVASVDTSEAAENIAYLPTITVIAAHDGRDILGVPTAVYQVDMPKQQSDANIDLAEVLQGVPGLQVKDRENFAQDLKLSIRGFGARSTFGVRGLRLYVDGIPATMPDGQGQTSNIDLNSLDNVEVMTGPFSSLYGNSSGGAILTESRTGQGQDSITVGVGAGSHDLQQATISAQGGSDKSNEPAYYISSSHLQTDGFREHSAADKSLQNAKLTWQLEDDSEINWVLNRVSVNADDPAGLTLEDWEDDPQQQASFLKQFDVRKDLEQTQTGVTWEKPIADNQYLYAMTYIGQRDMTQYLSIPASAQANPLHSGAVIDFERLYYGADIRWMAERLFSDVDLAVGVSLDRMDEDRQGYENFDETGEYGVKGELRRDEDNTMWNIDPYVQAYWPFAPNLSLDAGLRYSNVSYGSDDHYVTEFNPDDSGDVDFHQLLPSVALNWDISDNLNGYVAYGKGFETPTFTEMAYRPDGLSGVNTDLKSATSDTYEIGLKAYQDLGLITGALFYTETNDDIVSGDAVNGRSTYRNADKTLRQGIELAWQKDIWRDLGLHASYQYIDATFDEDIAATESNDAIAKGTKIPGISKNQAYLGLDWQPDEGLFGGLDVRYVDRVYVDDENSDYAPSYTVVDMNVGYTWLMDSWQVNSYAKVNNVFDRNYAGSVIVNDRNGRYFEPADGRNFSAGLSVTKQF